MKIGKLLKGGKPGSTESQASASQEQESSKPKQLGLQIKLPGMPDFAPLGRWQYKRIYKDDIGPRLLCILDECAELIEPTGVKTTEGKEEDALKQEIVGLIKSITQLGRSSGMHCILAPLALDTPVPTPYGWTTMGQLKPGDRVFDHSGQSVEVLDTSDVKMSEDLYRLKLECYRMVNGKRMTSGVEMEVVADGDHCFPACIGWADGVFKMTVRNMMENMMVIKHHIQMYGVKHELFVSGLGDGDVRWKVVDMQRIENQSVMCILVHHPKHQFLICGKTLAKQWINEYGCESVPSVEWLRDHCVVSYNTQRNDASIIPGVIQNNPLSVDTRLRIRRKIDLSSLEAVESSEV